jgi:peroxiredoxin
MRAILPRMTDPKPPAVEEIAPDFTLADATAAPHRLADLCAERPLVLVFYRGHW